MNTQILPMLTQIVIIAVIAVATTGLLVYVFQANKKLKQVKQRN
jgi:hypothetical protein